MSETLISQNEKAFSKQDAVFAGRKANFGRKGKIGVYRYTRQVGLGYKTPKNAIEGTYVDKKCPFTGNVSIRGRILKGTVAQHKMKNTLIVRRNYLHYIKKYNRFEKRNKTVAAHVSPCFRTEDGDGVVIGECRPLSKTVRFNVIRLDSKAGGSKGIKLFAKF